MEFQKIILEAFQYKFQRKSPREVPARTSEFIPKVNLVGIIRINYYYFYLIIEIFSLSSRLKL